MLEVAGDLRRVPAKFENPDTWTPNCSPRTEEMEFPRMGYFFAQGFHDFSIAWHKVEAYMM